MNNQLKNTSQEVVMKGLVNRVAGIINNSDISEMLGEWYATLAMLLRTDELLEVLNDQNVVLGEKDLHTLNQYLVNLEKLRDNHETSIDEYEEVVCNLLNYLRNILTSFSLKNNRPSIESK